MSKDAEDEEIDYRLIDEPHLEISRILAIKFGLKEAIFIGKIHSLLLESGKEIDGQKWIYHSIIDWQKCFPFWSKPIIKRTLNNLIMKNVILCSDLKENKWNKKLLYTFNHYHFSYEDEIRGDNAKR